MNGINTKTKTRSKVLIVDDEPNIVLAIDFLMQKKGFNTAKAYNGEQALELLNTFEPNIVILDVMMPGINGFEVAKRVRQNAKNDYVNIIFLTAKGTEKDRINGYSTGGDIYLTKPFDNNELSEVVEEMLQYG